MWGPQRSGGRGRKGNSGQVLNCVFGGKDVARQGSRLRIGGLDSFGSAGAWGWPWLSGALPWGA